MIDQIFSEAEYRSAFHARLTDRKAIAFSKKSLDFHLRFYSFECNPVLASRAEDGSVASVMFCAFTQDGYVSVINLLTDPTARKSGHARKLMSAAVAIGWQQGKRRLRMNCEDNRATVGFYNALGFVYLGLTKTARLYCNVPLQSGVLAEQRWVGKSIRSILGEDRRTLNLVKRRIDWVASAMYALPEYLPKERYLNSDASLALAHLL